MELLWIFVILFQGCLANVHKEKCGRECIVFNIPHILCAPDVSKVSVSPYYEYAVPKFRNLLFNGTKEYHNHQGEDCTAVKPKPCEEIQKTIECSKSDCLNPDFIIPKRTNPDQAPQVKKVQPPLISVKIDSIPQTSLDKSIRSGSIIEKTSSPVEILAIDVGISRDNPAYIPPYKAYPVSKESNKSCPPHDKPPDCHTCPLPECYLPILPNAPTSRFIFPDCSCESCPQPYVNPRYLYELYSLYKQPPKCTLNTPPHRHCCNPITQNIPGQILPTVDTRGMKKCNPHLYSVLLDSDFPPEGIHQFYPAIKPDNNKNSNIYTEEPRNCNTKNVKDQCLIQVGTEKCHTPLYTDSDYMYNLRQALQPHPQTQPNPHPQTQTQNHPHLHPQPPSQTQPHPQLHPQSHSQHHPQLPQHHLKPHPQFPLQPHPQLPLQPHPQLPLQPHPQHIPQPSHYQPPPKLHPQQHHPQLPPHAHIQPHPQAHPHHPHHENTPPTHPEPFPHPKSHPQPHHHPQTHPHLHPHPNTQPQSQPHHPQQPHPQPQTPPHPKPHSQPNPQPHQHAQPHPQLHPQPHQQPHHHPQPLPKDCDKDDECPEKTTPPTSEQPATELFGVNFLDYVLENLTESDNQDEKDTHDGRQTEGKSMAVTIPEVSDNADEASEIKKLQM